MEPYIEFYHKVVSYLSRNWHKKSPSERNHPAKIHLMLSVIKEVSRIKQLIQLQDIQSLQKIKEKWDNIIT
jgi:hypothetical protein